MTKTKNTLEVTSLSDPPPPPFKNPFFDMVRKKIYELEKGKGVKIVSTFTAVDIYLVSKRIGTIAYTYAAKCRGTDNRKFTVRIIDDKTVGVWRTQ